jgi:O-acetyl-ADP-ribose deacetylase (regulator of RNase III)
MARACLIEMIDVDQGDLLRADVEALVNPINCVGHMGKGLALQFRKALSGQTNHNLIILLRPDSAI